MTKIGEKHSGPLSHQQTEYGSWHNQSASPNISEA